VYDDDDRGTSWSGVTIDWDDGDSTSVSHNVWHRSRGWPPEPAPVGHGSPGASRASGAENGAAAG
jgi:hypothetical protein